MTTAFIDQPFRVELQTVDYRDDVYPVAQIFDSAGVLLTTLSLPLAGDGLYYLAHTFTVVGTYTIKYKVYLDTLHTVLGTYDPILESVAVQPETGISSEELETLIRDLVNDLLVNNGNSPTCPPNTVSNGKGASLGLKAYGAGLNLTSQSSKLES